MARRTRFMAALVPSAVPLSTSMKSPFTSFFLPALLLLIPLSLSCDRIHTYLHPDEGKIGFIDLHLALVIPARYDGALPFQDAGAEVCIDCRLISHGEHSSYEGGRWACIDHHGRERKPFSADRGAGQVCGKDS